MSQQFSETFIRDAEELLTALHLMAENTPAENSSADSSEIARALHSLKSGASFLGWEDLETEAHNLESLMADTGAGEIDWSEAAVKLSTLLDGHRPSPAAPADSPVKAVRFSALEKRVLAESRQRGERLYRLTCVVDSAELLPYPRAYLVSSRLETTTTLVKTVPPMNEPDANFFRPVFWLTTDSSEDEIYKAADVDLVSVAELTALDIAKALSMEELPVGSPVLENKGTQDSLIVDRGRYNSLRQIASELAWRLDHKPDFSVSSLITEMQRSLENLAYHPLEPLLEDIAEGVTRIAGRRGIEAALHWETASGGLDAPSLDVLSEILRQMARNSLRHGVESPEERVRAGKNPQATLFLRMERSGTSYRFRFEDDGRGIDKQKVIERALREGLFSSENPAPEHPEELTDAQLLNILCLPGFSSAETADTDGGRGLGLEMVRQLLVREFGSELELENKPGQGTAFQWSFPEKHLRQPYLVFVVDKRSWALPLESVYRRGVMEPEKMNAAGQAYTVENGLVPLVSPKGLLPPGTLKPYILEIRHRGRRAVLPVDDLLSEEPWGVDDLVPAEPATPWCRALKDRRDNIPILSPAVVYAALELTDSGTG